MINGVGVDVVEHTKILNLWLRHERRAREVVFSWNELREMNLDIRNMPDRSRDGNHASTDPALLTQNQVKYLASRFAAKEAAIKVLGLGIRIPYELSDIEVLGKTALRVKLSPDLADHARALGISLIAGTTWSAGSYTVSCLIGEECNEQPAN
jgi:phosphopantetheine--protein transferase-like protein